SESSSPVLGVVTADQRVPFQCSASVRVPGPTPVMVSDRPRRPTAQRSLLATPSTAARTSTLASGLAVGTTDHAEPFQCIARVRPCAFAPIWLPTAQTSAGPKALTPVSLSTPTAGSAVVTHETPSERRAIAWPRPSSPTAHTSLALSALTERSTPLR